MAIAGGEQTPPAEGVKPEGTKPETNADGTPKTTPQADTKPAPAGKPGEGDDPKHRGLVGDLQKERAARKKLEGDLAALTERLAQADKRTKALVGIETPSDEEAEAEEIRAKLLKVMPGLGKVLDAKTLERLERLLSMTDTLEQTTQHYWGQRGLNSLQAIEKKIAETFGDLSERQIKRIRAAYVTEAETDPEFAKRHESDPESLIEEFAKQWVEDWFEPSKRKVTAEEIARQPRVPGARDRNLVAPGTDKPIDFTDDKAVGDALVNGFKARGGMFGRR